MGRGVLHQGEAAARFRLARYDPGAALAPFVDYHWIVAWDLRGADPHDQKILPHPNVNLVFEDSGAAIFGIDQKLFVRRLQRLFADYVGVSPKWVMRRARLHEAAERAEGGGQVDWAALASDLGYADQAHLTRDFTETIGVPPARYAAATLPVTEKPLSSQQHHTSPGQGHSMSAGAAAIAARPGQ